MANKITTKNEDLFPKMNDEPDDAMKELLKVRDELVNEEQENENNEVNNETEQPEPSPKKKTSKTTKKKSNSSTERKLTTREIMEQGESGKRNKNDVLMMSERQDVIKDMKVQFNDVISKMTIDLNNIVISDSLDSMEKHTNTDIVFNSKPTFEVPLAQSCYTAYMQALVYSDINSIIESTGDNYSVTLKTYQVIYNRIQATSVGKFSFETFLECTSFFDLASLYYGLHMQTFPGTTNFTFECRSCKEKFSQDIPNDALVFSKDDAIYERLDKVRREADNPKYIIENSLLSKHNRICLNDSKMIIDIRIPSLKNQLDILKSVPAEEYDAIADDLTTILFFKNVYMINVPETVQKQSPVYYELKGNMPIINAIKQLTINDSKQLSKAIEDWTEKYKVEYKIPSFSCPKCKASLGDMSIDMENTLFRLMLSL